MPAPWHHGTHPLGSALVAQPQTWHHVAVALLCKSLWGWKQECKELGKPGAHGMFQLLPRMGGWGSVWGHRGQWLFVHLFKARVSPF